MSKFRFRKLVLKNMIRIEKNLSIGLMYCLKWYFDVLKAKKLKNNDILGKVSQEKSQEKSQEDDY